MLRNLHTYGVIYIYIWFYYEYSLAYHIHFVMNILNIHWLSIMASGFNGCANESYSEYPLILMHEKTI
jgi:hypothetical protein